MIEKYILEEFNEQMGEKEYEMLQEIPAKENGSTNLCHGLPYECFTAYLESQMARKYLNISEYDTPTIMYVFYANNMPLGYVGIRTEINEAWKNWSGNIFYTLRPSKRNMGYGTKMLKYAIKECHRLGINPIYIQTSTSNLASQRVIEKNGGKLYKENASKYYVIERNNK